MSPRCVHARFRRVLVSIGCTVLASSLTGCELINDVATAIDPPAKLPSIDGPEDAQLLDDVHGTLVWSDRDHHAETLSLPHRDRLRFQVDSGAVSGPARSGLLLYRRRETSKQDVRWRDLSSGSEAILVEKVPPTSFFVMTLCASGDRAFIAWGDLQTTGHALTWTRASGERRDFGGLLVRNASWLPDGVHLVIEHWVSASEGRGVPPPELDEGWGTFNPIAESRVQESATKLWPGIEVLDTRRGDTEWIAWGRDPLVSPDGTRLLYELSPRLPLRLRDMASGTERDLELPGLLRRHHWPEGEEDESRSDGIVHQWLTNRIVIYDALPTSGRDPGYVSELDLQTFHAKWCIKAADVESLAFETVIDSVDAPECSFGPFELP